MPNRLTRRQMLRNTTLAGVGVWASGRVGLGKEKSPNEKLNIACIGVGGRGRSDLAGVASQNIVALCDADDRRAAGTYKKYPNVKRFADYRKLLDEMDRQIDAVVVATPNHIHAPASVTAMRMGKHCYCEKPLSHSVYESRVAAQVAAEKKVATQMGTQIHASGNFRRIVELIRAGAIGPVRAFHIWSRKGRGAGDRPKETPPVPKGLDWDVWLGPAPYRPYHPCYVPHDWHYWWDFGGGSLGNMGCHYYDLGFWALGLRYPTSVEASGSPVHPASTPAELNLRYEFPARGNMPPAILTWSQGRKAPPIWIEKQLPGWAWGAFVGDKGILAASYPKRMLLPEKKFADFKPPDPTIPDSIGHHREWILACKTGGPTTCNFDYSGAVTEAVLLGNVAFRLGKKIQWDPANLKVTNDPNADPYIKREYRKGWTL